MKSIPSQVFHLLHIILPMYGILNQSIVMFYDLKTWKPTVVTLVTIESAN